MKATQLTIPTDPYGHLARAADELVTEVGYFVLALSRTLGDDLMPSTAALDEALSEVTRILYKDPEAA